jgi:uncharacterized GH25 family protein
MARSAVALLAVLSFAAPLAAHDHWIAPSSLRPALGERVELDLRVGHPQEFERQIRDPRRIVRFESFAPGASEPAPVLGLDGKAPAGLFKAKAQGLHVLVFQSNHAFVEIEPAKYADFLREEGLEDVLAEREQRGESALPGRDSYARFDKALLRAEGLAGGGHERVVGLPLELVLESDPAKWSEGAPLRLRLLLDGKPIEGRQIKLTRLSEPHLVQLARTDAEGLVELVPANAGPFAAFAVHQRRATKEQGLEGDWEGLWASFTFELGAASAPTPVTSPSR